MNTPITRLDTDSSPAPLPAHLSVDASIPLPAVAKPRNPRNPRLAWRALKRLIDDPERTEEVFVIIRNLSGDALWHSYERIRKTARGSELLSRDLVATLSDRERLRALPDGSLGRAYYDFVHGENLSADGLVEASEGGDWEDTHPAVIAHGERLRDMHDLWHVTTGYGRDTFGELCLLAFTHAQNPNLGILSIVLIGGSKIRREIGRGTWTAAWRAWRDGKRAAWLPAADWEALLEQPLVEVRRQLGIGAPERYQRKLAAVINAQPA